MDVREAAARLDRVRDQPGLVVALLHHDRRRVEDRPDRPRRRGSSGR